jgi:beta-galactosidase GanA
MENGSILFGAAYYPETWPESERKKDIEMMKKAGMNVMRIGEFAWHKSEPEPGRYDFTWLHRVVDDLAANGIKTILGTPTATPPNWFLKEHPDAAVLYPNGQRALHGGRRHCCSNNSAYRKESEKIIRKLGVEFGSDPNVIGWQLDNELYQGDCVCDECREKFHLYLRKKYKTIDELNKAWNHEIFSQAYSSFDDIPMPVIGWQNPHLRQAWKAFQHDSDIEFIHMQHGILKEYTNAPIGTDMMPLNGVGYEKMCEPLDVLMFNHYNDESNLPDLPFWFDYLRTVAGSRPFWNTETATGWNGSIQIDQIAKPAGFCRVNSWLPIALGGRANLYWLWRQHWAGHELIHSSVIYADGRPLPMFDEIRQTSEEYKKAESFLNDTEVSAQIAMHFTSLAWQMFEVQPTVRGLSYYPALKDYFYHPIEQLGLRTDVIGVKKDLSEYKVLISPLLMSLEDEDLGDRIEEWVKNGGTWIAGPMTDIRTAAGTHFTDRALGRLERMTGARLIASMPDSGRYVRSIWKDKTPFSANIWQEVYSVADGAEPLTEVCGDYQSLIGGTLLQKCRYGKGNVWLLGTFPSCGDWQKLIMRVCEENGIKVPKASGSVCAIPRKGKGRRGIILIETAHQPASYELSEPMTDILTGIDYQGIVELKPYDVLILEERI